jgi:hypothetical protein
MSCSYCARPIPADAKICPHCGRATSSYYAASGTGADESTKISQHSNGMVGAHDLPLSNMPTPHLSSSDPYSSPVPPPPPTYNSDSSASLPPAPYNISTSFPHPPYAVPHTAVPPVPRKGRLLLNMGVLLLILLLLVGGIFVYFNRSSSAKVTGQSPLTSARARNYSDVTSSPRTPAGYQALYNRITGGTPVLVSSLNGPDNYGWDDYAQANTHCWFANGAYHSRAAPKYFSPCYAQATNFSNFLFQASVTVVSGHSGGLVFRADGKSDNGYYFRVSTDGTYILNKLSPNNLQALLSGSNASINKGMNQANLLAVLVQGNRISLFINRKYVESTTDTSYQAGQIGVYTDSDSGSVEAFFHQAQVWNI